MKPRVFLDTNVLHSSQVSTLMVPHSEKIEWAGRTLEVTVYSFEEIPMRNRLKGKIREEADLLPQIAALAKNQTIELLMGHEVDLEKGGLPFSMGQRKVMAGAPITSIGPPVPYARIIAGPDASPREYRDAFIKAFDHSRFLEIAKICGVDRRKPKENTLWDAFHVWSAEVAAATHFLTLDFRLINQIRNSKAENPPRVRPVRPSELFREVTG